MARGAIVSLIFCFVATEKRFAIDVIVDRNQKCYDNHCKTYSLKNRQKTEKIENRLVFI
jgi:hypothetical protein